MQKITTSFGEEIINDDGSIQFFMKSISKSLDEALEILKDEVFTEQERMQFTNEFMKMDEATAQKSAQDIIELLKGIKDLRLSQKKQG